MPKVMSDRARKALFAKGGRSRTLGLQSQTKGGPKMPMTASEPEPLTSPRMAKLSTTGRKSNSWTGA